MDNTLILLVALLAIWKTTEQAYILEERQTSNVDSCGNPQAQVKQSEIDVVVNLHNQYRKTVGATGIRVLQWDNELANMAQYLVNTCRFGHGHMNLCSNSQTRAGQNVFSSGTFASDSAGVNWNQLLTNSIRAFNSENASYDGQANTCQSGKTCGHYTQVVWAATTKVGCAYKFCGKTLLIACNYLKGGNVVGQTPFKLGPACSNCASVVSTNKAKCVNNTFCEPCPDSSTDPACKWASFPCLNKGTFNYDTGVCDCPVSYFGNKCQYNGCLNGATYVDQKKSCVCPKAYCLINCRGQDTVTYCSYFTAHCQPGMKYYGWMHRVCPCWCASH